MAYPLKPQNLRILMIEALKEILLDELSPFRVATKFDSSKPINQIRVNYMGSDRVDTLFLSVDYSIDVLAQTFDEAERLSYKICEKLQDYKKNGLAETEVLQFPIEYIEDGIDGELRSISLECLIRPKR